MGSPRRGYGRTTPRNAAGVGARSKGVCPVCRGLHRLRGTDGKMMPHGRSATNPRGCAGHGEPPVRDATGEITRPVQSMRQQPEQTVHAEAELPEIAIEARDVPAHKRPLPGGGVA